MERSTARVFAIRQMIALSAVSGRGTKVEGTLVVIPGYSFLCFGTGAAFALKCRMRAGCYHRLLKLSISRCGNPGVIPSYLFIQMALPTQKP